MRSWHDFHITGYAVNGEQREISFEVKWPYESESVARRAKIVFCGVEAYFLEHDLGANIVYDFSEQPLRQFLEEWAEHFESSCKYGWPKFWRPQAHPARPVAVELEDAYVRLANGGAKCVELASSYGMSGWLIAAAVREEIIEV